MLKMAYPSEIGSLVAVCKDLFGDDRLLERLAKHRGTTGRMRLHHAAMAGDEVRVHALLSSGAPVDCGEGGLFSDSPLPTFMG